MLQFRCFRRSTVLNSIALTLLAILSPAFTGSAQDVRGQSGSTFEATPQQIVGTYMAHTAGDNTVYAEGGRLVLKLPQFTTATLVPMASGRFQIDSPQTKGWIALFRPGSFTTNTLELVILQTDGTQGIFTKRAPAPLARELAEYENLIGMYVAGQVKGEIVNLNGRLAFYEHGWPAFSLQPAGRDVFSMASAQGTGDFKLIVRREGGEVLGFLLKQPNRVSEYVKAGAVQQTVNAEQIRQKRIEAIGGEARLKAHRTLVMESELVFGSVSGQGKMWRRMPFASASEIEIPLSDNKKHVSRTVFDGNKGVEITAGKAPKEMNQSDIDWAMVDSPQEPLLWSQIYKSVSVLGTKRFDGRDCIAVAKTFSSGRTVTEYVDAATFLTAGIEGPMVVDGREVQMTLIMRDWRSVAGVRFPFIQVVRQGEINAEVRFTSVRWDVPVADRIFLVKDLAKRGR